MKLTVMASIRPSTLSKRYWLDENATVQKAVSANMVEGTAYSIELADLAAFAEGLTELQPNQALCYGIPEQQTVKVYSRETYQQKGSPADAITRTRDCFTWPTGPGIWFLDYDPREGGETLTRDDLLAQLGLAVPSLNDAGKVWWVSSSSFIYNGDSLVNGMRGQRVYIGVKDAADIPRAGKVLSERLWLAGFGYFAISKAGRLLERCLVDTSVWQPERLDFAAGAQCQPPLRQDRGLPVVFDGPLLDTRATLLDLTPEERAELDALRNTARKQARPQQEAVELAYIDTRAAEMADPADKEAFAQARKTVERAIEHSVLCGDFPITLASGEIVTVGNMMDDPRKYHGANCRDPLEPDYQNGKVCARVYLYGGRPNIHSFAHGGHTFKLIRQPRRIELVRGRTHDAVEATKDFMRDHADFYRYGDALATVTDGAIKVLNPDSLSHMLGGTLQYWQWRKAGDNLYEADEDPPMRLVRQLLEMPGDLKRVDAVLTAPVILPGGRLLSRPGYDPESRLFLNHLDPVPVPENPSIDQARQALAVLMHPFERFPFASPMDRAALLAALLTAVERPALPTAPAFGFDAPVQGSGKTLLASCVGALATGGPVAVKPHTAGRDDEETRKRILTAMMAGDRVLLWDNVLGIFDSASLAGMLTSQTFSDRVLGQSAQQTLPNRLMVLLTGNNLCLAGDMPRRVIRCRIDPQTDKPFAREFDLDPLEWVLSHYLEMVTAGLTLINAWLVRDLLSTDGRATGRMASFEVWDDLIRQTVAWVNREVAPGEYGDVMELVLDAQNDDPEQQVLLALLEALHVAFGERYFTAKEVVEKCKGFASDQLADALRDVSRNGDVPNSVSLGRILNNRKDRVIDGKVLKCCTNSDKTKIWQVRSLEKAGVRGVAGVVSPFTRETRNFIPYEKYIGGNNPVNPSNPRNRQADYQLRRDGE